MMYTEYAIHGMPIQTRITTRGSCLASTCRPQRVALTTLGLGSGFCGACSGLPAAAGPPTMGSLTVMEPYVVTLPIWGTGTSSAPVTALPYMVAASTLLMPLYHRLSTCATYVPQVRCVFSSQPNHASEDRGNDCVTWRDASLHNEAQQVRTAG